MRRLVDRLWHPGWAVGLFLALAMAAVACGGDEQRQSAAQQALALDTPDRQSDAEPDQVEEAVPTQVQAVQERPVQGQAQQTQQIPAQQQERPEQQATTSAAAEQSQSESDDSDQAQQQRATAPQSSTQDQQGQPMMQEESVPDGTRLITLFGDLTEIVYALGVQEFLVARDTSSIYPAEAEELPNLGFAGGLNAEAILEFDPTLVLGTPMAGPPGVLEQLKQAGVEVLIIEDSNELDAPQIKIRIVGEALGIPQRAEELALDIEQRLEAVQAAAVTEKPLRVLMVYIRRGGLQLVSGEGNKSQTIIEAAGAIDAATEAGIVGWQPLTPEALVAANPDVYLVMDRGLAVVGGIEGLLEIPGMAQTKAGRNRHIVSMPDLYLLGFGPRLPEAIADLTQFLRETQAEIVNE